jgi:hypothetical protein
MLSSLVRVPFLLGVLAWAAWPASIAPIGVVEQQHPPAGGPSKPKKKVEVHKVVDAGLVWLARHQFDDGSWGARRLQEKCGPTKCFVSADDHDGYDVGITALATLAFLRAGHVPGGTKTIFDPLTKTTYKTAEVVTRALEWLRKGQIESGEFASAVESFVYDEALAELAMSSVCALVKDDHWKDSAQRGANALVKAQRVDASGKAPWGWRYARRADAPAKSLSDSDTSATGWCVVALAAAQSAGLEVDKQSLAGALAYLDSATGKDGKVGYLDAATAGVKVLGKRDQYTYHIGTMSALAILIRSDVGVALTDPFFDLAAGQILKDEPAVSSDGLSVDYYYWYHGSEALNRLDELQSKRGKGAKKIAAPWNEALIEAAASLQDQHADRCSFGGFVTEDRWWYSGGAVYATSMVLLALEATHAK